MSKIEQLVSEKIETAILEEGGELVDVTFEKGRNTNDTLWVFVFSQEGTSLDFLEKIHRKIDPIIDTLAVSEGQFNLNVSSPGLDRAFKTQRDYERNYGTDIEIKFYAPFEGKKTLSGKLLKFDGETIEIETDEKKLEIPVKITSKVSVLIKF